MGQNTSSRSSGLQDSGYRFFFVLLILFSAGIRLKYLFAERLWPDEALYAWYGLKIYTSPLSLFSGEIVQFHPPLFAVFLAIGHLFLPSELACRFVAFLFNLLGLVVIYHLGTKIRSRFMGLLSAIFLSLNYFYISTSTHILIDNAQAVFIMWLVIAMASVRTENARKEDVIVGVLGAGVILLKWSGVLVVPLIILYYGYLSRGSSWMSFFKKVSWPLGIILTTIVLLLINNLIQLGHFLPDISALKGVGKAESPWFYVVRFHNILIIPYLFPFFLFGLYVTIRGKEKSQKLLLLWFALFLVGLSLAAEKVLRYGILLLPPALLITGIGVEEAIARIPRHRFWRNKIKGFVILLALLACAQFYPRTRKLLDRGMNKNFVGFKEADVWIKQKRMTTGRVIAGSPRIIRYYSGLEFERDGGVLSGFPEKKEDFAQKMIQRKGPVLLIVDRWEWTQPGWIHPLSEEKINYLQSLGFNLMSIIRRPIGSKKDVPVIWFFRRN